MINCVIIEDEPLAQNGLINLIRPYPVLKLLTVCDDIKDFLEFQKANNEKRVDLLFLDIELPGINGINFLRSAQLEMPVVLTTAYNEYAIEGYELNVLDYLLKPISKERFRQTIAKAEHYIESLKKASALADFVYVKSDKTIEKVMLNDLILVEAMRNYVIYHCEKQKLICYTPLKSVEQSLPPDTFVRIQKSFIVNKNKIQKIEKGYVMIQNRTITLNRENKSEIIKRLMSAAF
jgi:two-component system, LytTR family, response regulator